jgi:hypothetical protein
MSFHYLVPLKPQGTKNPLFLIHGAGLNILNFSHVINHFDKEQPVYGFQGMGPNGYEDWFESIEEMAATYTIHCENKSSWICYCRILI